jgi:hypothetical protein
MEPGEVLSFANPLPNVARDTIVASVVVSGADAEAWEVYRQRVLDRFQKRPEGGAASDYEIWAETVPGIINAYPYRSADCPGTAEVYVEATPESSGSPDGIPTQAQLDAVADAIEFDDAGLASRRPLSAFVNVLPITRLGFDVEIVGLDVTDPAAVQDDIIDAVTEHLLEREPYIPGLSVPPRRDRVSRASISGVVDDVVSAAEGVFSNVILELGGGPIDLYTLGVGEKAKALTVSFS